MRVTSRCTPRGPLVPALLALVLTGASASTGPATASGQTVQWKLAVTVDDLPMSGGAECDADEVRLVNEKILDTMEALGIRATAFAVPGSPCGRGTAVGSNAMVSMWRAAGHEVGNHTHSHPDFNALTAAQYLAEAQRAHDALEPVLRQTAQSARWFRAPMLHMGNTPEKRAALERWLERLGYRNGVVTIDNQEWVYAAAYARAQHLGDIHMSDRVADAYIAHIRDAVAYYRGIGARLFGRETPQVLLLHVNRLNADHLPRLAGALQADGAVWTTLDEALSDSAYRTPDPYIGARGLSWLLRWASGRREPVGEEPREVPWVAEYSQAAPVARDSALAYRTMLELDAHNAAFSRAWTTGDFAALVDAYAPDATIQPPPDGVLRGHRAVEAFWRANLPKTRTAHRLQPTLRQPLSVDAVLELGRWHSQAGPTDAATGCYTVIWQRDRAGVWRMHHDAWRAANAADWACRPRAGP